MRRVLFATVAFAIATSSWGHLVSNSLKLSRTGPYHPGDTLTVTFGVDQPHSGCNIDLTLDGKKWTSLKSNMPAASKQNYSYKWTVGQDTTSKGKIRICQMDNGSVCTDADSTNKPAGVGSPARYVLVSAPFSITPSVSALSKSEIETSRGLFKLGAGSLEVSFSLSVESPVSLIAYDAQGREAAVLLRDRYAAGDHRISIRSESLRAHPEWILRLDAAGRIEALQP